MTAKEYPHGETVGGSEAGASALSPSVVAALAEAGLTEADFVSQLSADGVWYGDTCGCSDDRCIGFHHDETSACGCFPTMLDQAVEGLERQARARAKQSEAEAEAATAEAAPVDAAATEAGVVEAVAELGEAEL